MSLVDRPVFQHKASCSFRSQALPKHPHTTIKPFLSFFSQIKSNQICKQTRNGRSSESYQSTNLSISHLPCPTLLTHPSLSLSSQPQRGSSRGGNRGNARGGSASRGSNQSRGGGRGGAAGGAGGAGNSADKAKKEAILDLGKYLDKKVRVKFMGGREGKSQGSTEVWIKEG